MQLRKSYHLLFQLMGGVLFFVLPAPNKSAEIRYAQAATIPFDWDKLEADTVFFQDTLSGEMLQLIKTTAGIPLFYARDIMTGVCFDNKCRPLNMTVYWNITGRYLGFGLPEGEFLSRYDHAPFKTEDYIRLNTLLADPHLPFNNVSFEELVQTTRIQPDSVDAVSGATSKDILDYVVEGAAYTTYTLWNIVYGPTQDKIKRHTEQGMTPELLSLILRSPASADRIWGFGQMDETQVLETMLENALLEVIGSEDFFAAYTAINSIRPDHLRSESLQIGLVVKYEELNQSLGKLIIEKLKYAPVVSPVVINRTSSLLDDLNGAQLGNMLELYNRHSVDDVTICRLIARLLEKDNKFIASKAYHYLMGQQIDDSVILQALQKYKRLQKE